MIDPLAQRLKQPDRRSCGAATVVMAELLEQARVRPFADAKPFRDFDERVLAKHRALTSFSASGSRSGMQVPWPQALGTPPWSIANAFTRLYGRPYRTRVVRWPAPSTFNVLGEAPMALYVGSRLLPRHVVLVLDRQERSTIECWEPSRGRVVRLEQSLFPDRLDLAGWDYSWFLVAPSR